MSNETPIKPRIDFATAGQTEKATLREAREFTGNETAFTPLELHTELSGDATPADEPLSAALRPRPSLWRRILLAGMVLFLVSVIARTTDWLIIAWQTRQWIDLGAIAALGLVVIAGLGSLLAEGYRLYRLRYRAQERDEARALMTSHGIGKARPFCEKLASRAGIDTSHPAYLRWQAELQDSHNDREVIALYASRVQPLMDRQARARISRFAAESALMIAVSPLAMADMAFIAWRNIRMINQIAGIYGIRLGYFSRLTLFRGVLFNIAFAGTSELIREAGLDWMSQDIMARLSARAAQGIGAGLLTARLGIKAMELCRPLPFSEEDKPRLGDYRTELLAQLRESLKKKAVADPSS